MQTLNRPLSNFSIKSLVFGIKFAKFISIVLCSLYLENTYSLFVCPYRSIRAANCPLSSFNQNNPIIVNYLRPNHGFPSKQTYVFGIVKRSLHTFNIYGIYYTFISMCVVYSKNIFACVHLFVFSSPKTIDNLHSLLGFYPNFNCNIIIKTIPNL